MGAGVGGEQRALHVKNSTEDLDYKALGVGMGKDGGGAGVKPRTRARAWRTARPGGWTLSRWQRRAIKSQLEEGHRTKTRDLQMGKTEKSAGTLTSVNPQPFTLTFGSVDEESPTVCVREGRRGGEAEMGGWRQRRRGLLPFPEGFSPQGSREPHPPPPIILLPVVTGGTGQQEGW